VTRRLSPDDTVRAHRVFGVVYERSIAPEIRKFLHGIDLPTKGFVVEGDDAITDELVVLELGAAVELEWAMQDMAALGWPYDLGAYLRTLTSKEDDE
jgi:hypothetical protein